MSIEDPTINKKSGGQKTFEVKAKNLYPDLMEMATYSDSGPPQWYPFTLSRVEYQGLVYSLNVSGKSRTYFADNVWTHNCLFKWCGADPHGMIVIADTSEVLAQSWRVPRQPHALAELVIGQVKQRVKKTYMPVDKDGAIKIEIEYNPLKHPESHTVLCRDRWSLAEIQYELIYNGMPYRAGDSLFYRPQMRAIRALLLDDIVSLQRLHRCFRSEFQQKILDGKFPKGHWQDLLDLSRCTEAEINYFHLVDPLAEPHISISTIHSFKGKEDDNIVLCAVCSPTVEDAVDASLSCDDEYRTWYVGCTRTRGDLTIIGSNQFMPI